MKAWEKPKLIVLVRNRPEEAVLGACKYFHVSGAQSGFNGCQVTPPPTVVCTTNCNLWTAS